MEKKKKDEPFIIPPSHFAQAPVPAPALVVSKEQKESIAQKETTAEDPIDSGAVLSSGEGANPVPDASGATTLEKKAESAPAAPALPAINSEKKKVSGLSLKSIQRKKELEAQLKEVQKDTLVERNEAFTEVEMQQAWKEFVEKQNAKGEKILASIMETDIPVLEDHTIVLELPNETMKLELERIQYPLMGFLKEKLQNTQISLEIKVNEKIAKKYAFTPLEKYEKLKEKNAIIEKLRTTFDLDI